MSGFLKGARSVARRANILAKTSVGSSNHPNTLFVWIPKTAGTSLFSALEKQLGMVNLCESIGEVKAFKNTGAVTFGHYHYRSLVSAGFVSQAFHDSAYKFCVVRDPYDRALSLYYYLRRKKGRGSLDFLEFLDKVYRYRPPVGMYNYFGLSQTNPQVDWIIDDDEGFVVDKVYRFEDMEQIQHDICRIFGLSEFEIGHKNKIERDQEADALFESHSEIIPLIEEIYSRDFFLLDYAKKSSETKN